MKHKLRCTKLLVFLLILLLAGCAKENKQVKETIIISEVDSKNEIQRILKENEVKEQGKEENKELVPEAEISVENDKSAHNKNDILDNDSKTEISQKKDNEGLKDYTEQGRFDVEQLRSAITLNGEEISLPCTLGDIGSEYYYDEDSLRKINPDSEPPTRYRISLINENLDKYSQNQINIYFNNFSPGDDINLAKITGLSMMIEQSENYMSLGDIGLEARKNDVLEAFGDPTQIYGEEELVTFSYEGKNGYMDIMLYKEKVIDISFNLK